jgi:hypothetical protein
VDFNDDGYLDLIAGEREGYVNFFSRKADGTLTEEPDIAANKAVIDVGTNSAPHVIDWDEDGLLDLLIGSDDSQKIIVYLNSGTASEYQFTTPTEVMCNNASIAYRRCIPHVDDLDLDGKKDLIIGEDNGCIYFLQNTGTNASPEFAAAEKLESDGAPIQWPSGQTDVTVWVNDWNEDGRPDILMGNYADSVYVYLNETPVEIIKQSSQSFSGQCAENIITGGTFSISINLKRAQNLQMDIFAADGKLIKSYNAGNLSFGKHSIVMDISLHPTGIYLIRYKIGRQEIRQRVVLLK